MGERRNGIAEVVGSTPIVSTISPNTCRLRSAADVTLSWSSASQVKEVVPASQLYPAPTGHVGEYFGNTNLTTAVLTRIEPQVNFSWGAGSRDPSVPTNTFSARWTGHIVPNFSETYTFSTRSDDDVRLWIDGVQMVTNWTNHDMTTNTGTINLVAGQRYDVKIEYYDNAGSPIAKLLWSSASQLREVVPSIRLSSPTNGRSHRHHRDEIRPGSKTAGPPGVRLVYGNPATAATTFSTPRISSSGTMTARGGAISTVVAGLPGRWMLTRTAEHGIATGEYWFARSTTAPGVYDVEPEGWLVVRPDNRVDAYLDDPCAGVFDPGDQTLHLQSTDAAGESFDLTGTRQ